MEEGNTSKSYRLRQCVYSQVKVHNLSKLALSQHNHVIALFYLFKQNLSFRCKNDPLGSSGKQLSSKPGFKFFYSLTDGGL